MAIITTSAPRDNLCDTSYAMISKKKLFVNWKANYNEWSEIVDALAAQGAASNVTKVLIFYRYYYISNDYFKLCSNIRTFYHYVIEENIVNVSSTIKIECLNLYDVF